jgi:DNA-binding response OmpR family regulator
MPETVLVVDDDPDIARFVEVNLRSAGYDVAVASDGQEALDKAEKLHPDLVLLDVMMPRIDGFEVAQRLRKNPQTANTSIIMLTAKALSADKVTGLQSGADDYIIKPFDPIELLARVKGTLRRAKEMRNLSPGCRATSGSKRRSSGRFASSDRSPCSTATSTTSRPTTTRRDSSEETG